MHDTLTYEEPIGRYVVEYQPPLPPEHRAEMRLNGMNPDDYWPLKWSFEDRAHARRQQVEEVRMHHAFCRDHGYEPKTKFRLRDRGADAPRTIARSAW